MRKKFLAITLVAALCVGTLAACGVPKSKSDDSSKESKTSGGNVLRYAVRDDPPTLDPQLMNSIPCTTIGFHIFDGLMRYQDGKVIPASAETHEVSEDGMTYTFHLRDGLKWSDGKPVTAGDYEYGFKRLVDPNTASEYAFYGAIIKNGTEVNQGTVPVEEYGVKALDDKTLEVQLKNPAPYFLGMLSNAAYAPTRKDIVETNGKEFAGEADKNVYNGPFVIKEWKHNDRVILEKNPNYWDADSIKLDGAEILTVPDANTAVAMYESGELDYTEVPQVMRDKYKDEVEFFSDGSADYMELNQDGSNPYLANKNMRLALNFGLNRDEYVKLIGGVYAPGTRYVLPEVTGVKDEYGKEYPYEPFKGAGEPDKAKEYLATAMSELGIANASDITLELLTADTDSAKKQAEVLQAQWEKSLGIKINVKMVPYKQRLQLEAEHNYEMCFSGWVPDYNDALSYLEIWTTESSYNRASYSSEAYDAAIQKSNTVADPKERMDSLFEAEQIFCDDAVVVPLNLRRTMLLKNEKVQNLKTSFSGYTYDFTHVEMK